MANNEVHLVRGSIWCRRPLSNGYSAFCNKTRNKVFTR